MVMSPVLVPTQDPTIAAKQQIARVARRIIARNYGAIARILNIKVAPNGLITVWFQDDDVDNKIIKMTIGNTTKYREVTGDRLDSLADEPVDEYLMAYANGLGFRLDAIAKPKNCKIGTSCKGSCIAKGDICRDVVVSRQELSAINEAVTVSQKPLASGEVDKYEGLNIRDLKEEARSKGIMRYSYMTQDQLKGALRIYDQDPSFQESIRKTLQRDRDEATLKKARSTAVGRAIGIVNPVLGRQYNLISSIGKRYEGNPAEARILAVAALTGIAVVASKSLQKNRAENIKVAAVDAGQRVSELRDEARMSDRPSVTFVVGSYSKGSRAFYSDLTSSGNISEEDKRWLQDKTQAVVVSRDKEGVPPRRDPVGAIADNLATGYEATLGSLLKTGRSQEATELAAKLYAYGSTPRETTLSSLARNLMGEEGRDYSDRGSVEILPAINVFAAEDGGLVARDALDILKAMGRVNGTGPRGSEVASRVKLVTFGTPFFGLASYDTPEANLMGDGDPWNTLAPFKKGGAHTRTASGVSGSKQSDYARSSDAMDQAFSYVTRNEGDRVKDVTTKNTPREKVEDTPAFSSFFQEELAKLGKSPSKADIEKATRKAKDRARNFNTGMARIPRAEDEVKGDSIKKLNCKNGYKQRGSACQKLVETDGKKLVEVGAVGAGVIASTVVGGVVAHRATKGEIQKEGLRVVSSKEVDGYKKTGKPSGAGTMSGVEFLESPSGEKYVKKQGQGALNQLFYKASKEVLVSDIAKGSGVPHVDVKLVVGGTAPATLQSLAIGEELDKTPQGKTLNIQQGSPDSNIIFSRKNLESMSAHPDLAKIAALDTFIGNPDRHNRNIFYDKKNDRYTAIDSEFAFYKDGAKPANEYFSKLDFATLSPKEMQGVRIYLDTLKSLSSKNPPSATKSKMYGYAEKSGENVIINTVAEIWSRGSIGESAKSTKSLIKTLEGKMASRGDSSKTEAYWQEYNSVRTDEAKKLRCKQGYVQRGAACQKNKGKAIPNATSSTSKNWQRAGIAAASLLGLSLAGYVGARERYRSGYKKSAGMAIEASKGIKVEANEDQHTVVFGVGGAGYADKNADVRSGKHATDSFVRAFSKGDGKKDDGGIKSVYIDNSKSNIRSSAREYEGDNGVKKALKDIADVAPIYGKMLRDGRQNSAVDLAASVIAYGDKYPDKQLVMVGHSMGGYVVHEAQEILRAARPDYEKRLTSFAIGTEWFGIDNAFGKDYTIGSKNDEFTNPPYPTRNLRSFDNVQGHTLGGYMKDPDVKKFLQDTIYGGVADKEAKRSQAKKQAGDAKKNATAELAKLKSSRSSANQKVKTLKKSKPDSDAYKEALAKLEAIDKRMAELSGK